MASLHPREFGSTGTRWHPEHPWGHPASSSRTHGVKMGGGGKGRPGGPCSAVTSQGRSHEPAFVSHLPGCGAADHRDARMGLLVPFLLPEWICECLSIT